MGKKNTEKQTKPTPTKKPVEAGKKKKAKQSSGIKNYIKKYCKAEHLPYPTKDAHVILQAYYDNLLDNVINHAETLFKAGKPAKMFTDDTVRLAVQSLVNQQGVNPKLLKHGIRYSDKAVENISKNIVHE